MPFHIKRSHPLSSRDLKKFLQEVQALYTGFSKLALGKPRVTVVEFSSGELLYYINGAPLLLQIEGRLLPSLRAPDSLFEGVPRVVVDMGAVPHVVNGADVMAPGVVSYAGSFSEGDVVVVVDERHGKRLSVGIALRSCENFLSPRRGKVIRNLHYVGDRVWKFTEGKPSV